MCGRSRLVGSIFPASTRLSSWGSPLRPAGAILADHALAGDLATRAGELLVTLREELAGAAPSLRQELGDQRSAFLILGLIADLRPNDAVLVEDAVDGGQRLTCDRVWIIDPLDGTREFGEPGRKDWAVHVALWSSGRLVAGAVALPATGGLFQAHPPASTVERRPGPMRIAASRTRAPEVVHEIARELGAEVLLMGSAGAKAMAVVTGHADAYIHAGGQYEWDSAAPVAVARAAGLHASRLDGSDLVYNQPDAWLPDLVVCRPEIVDKLLSLTGR